MKCGGVGSGLMCLHVVEVDQLKTVLQWRNDQLDSDNHNLKCPLDTQERKEPKNASVCTHAHAHHQTTREERSMETIGQREHRFTTPESKPLLTVITLDVNRPNSPGKRQMAGTA